MGGVSVKVDDSRVARKTCVCVSLSLSLSLSLCV